MVLCNVRVCVCNLYACIILVLFHVIRNVINDDYISKI